MSVTHIAGPMIGFVKADRAIQRCALCGYKLEDLHPSCVMVMTAGGESNEIPQFAVGHLIRVTEGNPTSFSDLGEFETADLPDDFCLPLVEE